MIALGAAGAREDKSFAGAEAVPDDREKTADAAAQAAEPENGDPPQDRGQQTILGLKANCGESEQAGHSASLGYSAGRRNGGVRRTDNPVRQLHKTDRIVRPTKKLNDAVKGAAGGGECVDAARGFGVFDEWRGVVWFESRIDHQRTAAAPVFVFGEGVDAVDIGGGVGARERDPEEVAEGFGDELRVVDDNDEAETGKCGVGSGAWGMRI